MTDGKILDLFFARSQQAVAEVRKKYGGRMARLAQNILGDRLDAEECVNDALLAAWNSIPPQRPDPLLPWLFATVRNVSMNRYRLNAAQKRGAGSFTEALEEWEDSLAAVETTEAAVDCRELVRALNRFLGRLSRRDRALMMGRYFAGEPYHVLAERLDMTEGSCKRQAARLRERLEKYLRKEGIL